MPVSTPDVVEIPAGEGRCVAVERNRRFRVVDVEGGQVADLFAFAAADPAEHLSASHTRGHLNRLFPRPGEPFISGRRRPLLMLESDESPGVHDMLIPACDTERYARLGARDHASCAENLMAALAPHGITPGTVPQPVNLFMNIPVGTDGVLSWRRAPTLPGDGVTLCALDDLLVVVSACPQDLVDINGGRPTPLHLHLL